MRSQLVKFENTTEYVEYKEKHIKDNPNIRECGLWYEDDKLVLKIMEGFTE